MENKMDETRYNFKGLFKYISTVLSWTVFTILIIIGILLAYYYVSVKLYATKGEKFEPKFSVYTIVSESMEPTINVYDVIINTKVDDIDDIKVNDVITFISTWQVTYGMTITHRVVGTKTLDDGSTCLVTRGDNNTQEDQACVKESNVIGVVKAVIPGLGRIQSFLSSSFGWLLVVLIPALFIIIKDIMKIFNLAKSSDEKNEKDNTKKIDNIKDKTEEIPKLNEKDLSLDEDNNDEKEEESSLEKERLEKAYDDLKKVKNKNE